MGRYSFYLSLVQHPGIEKNRVTAKTTIQVRKYYIHSRKMGRGLHCNFSSNNYQCEKIQRTLVLINDK